MLIQHSLELLELGEFRFTSRVKPEDKEVETCNGVDDNACAIGIELIYILRRYTLEIY